jgi:hypothetical protein
MTSKTLFYPFQGKKPKIRDLQPQKENPERPYTT